MSVLTRLPRELRSRLESADPARGLDSGDRPDLDDLIARADGTMAELPPRQSGRRWRTVAPLAAMAAVVIVAAGVVVSRHADNSNRPERAGHGAVATDFPVSGRPRPIVLIGPSTDVGAFPSGDTKVAFENGAIDVAVGYPSPSPTVDGYPLLPGNEVVAQLLKARSCCATTSTRLTLTGLALTHHRFLTDRGERALPAWRIHFAGFAYDTYVLAIAAGGTYGDFDTSAGDATLSADGRRLTVWVVDHHRAADRCDIGYRQSLTSVQGTHGVRLDVRTSYDAAPASAARTPDRGVTTGYGCDNIGHVAHPLRAPRQGEANTKTVQLDKPLGNRIVVDERGRPYVVTR